MQLCLLLCLIAEAVSSVSGDAPIETVHVSRALRAPRAELHTESTCLPAVSPAPFAATSSPLPSTSVSAAEAASEAPSAAASNSEAVPVVPQPESPAEPLCPAQAVTPGVSPATASTARDSTSDTAVIAAPLGQLPPAAVSAVTTPLLTALKAGLLPAAALKPSIQPESLPAVGQFPPQLGSLAAAGGVAAALGGSDSSKQYVTVPVTAQTPIKQDTSTMAESADSEPADSEPALNGESPANLKPPTESPANTPSPTASSSSSSAAGDQSLASCVAPATWPQTVPGAAAAEAQPQPRAGLPPAAAHPIAPALPADSQTSPAAVPGPLEAALRPVEAPEFPATHPGPLEADPRPAKAPLPPAAETGPFNAPSRPEEAPGSPAAGPAPLAAAPMPAEAPGSSAAWSGPPGTALKPVPAGPTAAAPKPLLTKPVRKGRKGKDPDRLSMILQRIADDASPILPQGGIGEPSTEHKFANQVCHPAVLQSWSLLCFTTQFHRASRSHVLRHSKATLSFCLQCWFWSNVVNQCLCSVRPQECHASLDITHGEVTRKKSCCLWHRDVTTAPGKPEQRCCSHSRQVGSADCRLYRCQQPWGTHTITVSLQSCTGQTGPHCSSA